MVISNQAIKLPNTLIIGGRQFKVIVIDTGDYSDVYLKNPGSSVALCYASNGASPAGINVIQGILRHREITVLENGNYTCELDGLIPASRSGQYDGYHYFRNIQGIKRANAYIYIKGTNVKFRYKNTDNNRYSGDKTSDYLDFPFLRIRLKVKDDEIPDPSFPVGGCNTQNSRGGTATISRKGDVFEIRASERGRYFCTINNFVKETPGNYHYFSGLQGIRELNAYQFLRILDLDSSTRIHPGRFSFGSTSNDDNIYTGDRVSNILTIAGRKFRLVVTDNEHYFPNISLEGPNEIYEGAGEVEYTVKLDKPSTNSGLTLNVATITNTASEFSDFEPLQINGVSLKPGQTEYKFKLRVIDDNVYEASNQGEGENLQILVVLSDTNNPDNRVQTDERITILDNDYTLSFNEGSFVADEGSGSFSVQICASRIIEGINQGFTFTSSDITYPSDTRRPADLAPDEPWSPPPPLVVPYNPPSLEGKTFYFDPGKNCMVLKIPIPNDNEVRGSGSFRITATPKHETNNVLVGTAYADLIIKDDDTRASYPAGRIQMSFPKSDITSSIAELGSYRIVDINDADYRDCKAQAGGRISNHTITEGDTFLCLF